MVVPDPDRCPLTVSQLRYLEVVVQFLKQLILKVKFLVLEILL